MTGSLGRGTPMGLNQNQELCVAPTQVFSIVAAFLSPKKFRTRFPAFPTLPGMLLEYSEHKVSGWRAHQEMGQEGKTRDPFTSYICWGPSKMDP